MVLNWSQMTPKSKIQIRNQLSDIERRLSKTSDPSEIDSLGKELRKIEINIQKGIGEIETSLIESSDESKNTCDSDECSDTKSSKQCMRKEPLADPILEALNTFLQTLRHLTKLMHANNESLAKSFQQSFNRFLKSLTNLISDERCLKQINDMRRDMKENLVDESDFK